MKEKIQNFINVVMKVQPADGKDIGVVITSDENFEEVKDVLSSNENMVIYVNDKLLESDFLEYLEKGGAFLSPIILILESTPSFVTRQLQILSKEGQIQFPGRDEWRVKKVSAPMITLITQEVLDSSDNEELLNILSPVLRI